MVIKRIAYLTFLIKSCMMLKTQLEMETNNKELQVIMGDLVHFYNLDLKPRGRANKILFEHGLYSEIIIDFLRFFGVPANVRLIKEVTKTKEHPNCGGYILIPTPCPHFTSETFKKYRFIIKIDPETYGDKSVFIATILHELSHLILHSTLNAHRERARHQWCRALYY